MIIKIFSFINTWIISNSSNVLISALEHGDESHESLRYLAHKCGYIGLLIVLLFFLVLYVYACTCVMIIARKNRVPNTWMAYIPVLSFYLMVKVARRPWWWVFAMFIPLVNIIAMFVVLAEVIKRMGFEPWKLVFFFIPLFNLVFLGMIAAAKPVN